MTRLVRVMVAVLLKAVVAVPLKFWILEWYQKSLSQRFIYAQVQVGILSTSPRAGSFTMDDLTL